MSAELIIKSMLNDASITALIADRIATPRLPQNTGIPAVVYQVIDTIPRPNVNFSFGNQHAQSRVQINPLAETIAELRAIHEAIRGLLDLKHSITVDGVRVVSCRLAMYGNIDRDDVGGVWTQPADYMLIFEEQ